MKKLIAPIIGIAIVVAAMAWGMNRPYPEWTRRTAADAGAAEGSTVVSIVGRAEAAERGALWVTCGGGGPLKASLSVGDVQIIGGGSFSESATMDVHAHFGDGPDAGRQPAPQEGWVKPAGAGFFDAPDSADFIRRLSESEWVVIGAGGGGSMKFHVRRLEPYRTRMLAACGLVGEAAPPPMPPGG